MKYICDNCEKPTDNTYPVNDDECFCEKCFNEAITRAEMRYESWRDGNYDN